MSAAANVIVLRDGRTLRYLETGDPSGRPVFLLHATLGSKLVYGPHAADAAERGIRLIGHDRAGYGGSTAMPGRSIASEAADVRELADALGIDRFAVWGNSTGGSLALACASALSGRVVAVSSLAGVAPYPADGLDWFAAVDPAIVSDFQFFQREPVAWRLKMARDVKEMRALTQRQYSESLSGSSSGAERTILSPELLAFAFGQMQDGLSGGPAGFIDDYVAGVTAWGFDVGTIRVPVQLWHGAEDPMVPLTHARWLAAQLPDADIHLEPGEGHVSLFAKKIPEVHAWLLSHF